MKKILLVGNLPIYVNSISMLLKSRLQNVHIEIAKNYNETFTKLTVSNYQLVILNIETNVGGWTKNVFKLYPATPLLLFTDHISLKQGKLLYKAGVLGILPLSAKLDTIILAAEKVMSNQIFMTDEYQKYFVSNTPAHIGHVFNKLSYREAEVAILILKGERLIAISKSLNLRRSTVSTFKTRIYKKLGITNLFELNYVIKQSIKK